MARAKKSQKHIKRTDAEKKDFTKKMLTAGVVIFLILTVVLMAVSSLMPESSLLAMPRQMTTGIMTPIQSAFSGVVDGVSAYLRKLKLRGNLEEAYEEALRKIDELSEKAALYDEQLSRTEDLRSLNDEIASHPEMDPIGARVVDHNTGNYFSVLTLNVGSNHGVKDYMAVVKGEGLVGYVYDTQPSSCKVRCIIDNDASVAGKLSPAGDQGTVTGALGTTGRSLCYMYYLPENSLPRPGDMVVTSGVGMAFPMGIPIGTVVESKRGLDANKSYIIVQPLVDFQHLETVAVYRYVPAYAEEADVRSGTDITLQALVTARPVPTLQGGGGSSFLDGTAAPVTETPAPGLSQTPPASSETPAPGTDTSASPQATNIAYVPLQQQGTATPSPAPTATPSPSPAPTSDPGGLTVEDDE